MTPIAIDHSTNITVKDLCVSLALSLSPRVSHATGGMLSYPRALPDLKLMDIACHAGDVANPITAGKLPPPHQSVVLHTVHTLTHR
jgi:hypothetical protein